MSTRRTAMTLIGATALPGMPMRAQCSDQSALAQSGPQAVAFVKSPISKRST